jgi:hypothetical protein
MGEPGKELIPIEPRSPAIAPITPVSATTGRTLSMQRKVVALAIAAISDAISLGAEFVPPLQIFIDLVTAGALFAVLGFRWPLLPALVVEAIPGVAAFPSWVLVVAMLVGLTPTAKSER